MADRVNSRAKGAAFERDTAKQLFAELGITFKRDLDQYRQKDRGDLIAECDFPFVLECKVTARPGYQSPWTAQAFKAAENTGQHPCVVWKTPRQETRYRIWFDALAKGLGGYAVSSKHADLDIQGFAYIAREIMAENNRGDNANALLSADANDAKLSGPEGATNTRPALNHSDPTQEDRAMAFEPYVGIQAPTSTTKFSDVDDWHAVGSVARDLVAKVGGDS